MMFTNYPKGYERHECSVLGFAYTPVELAGALKEFANSTVDALLSFTTNDGAKLYLLREKGLLFIRSEGLDEDTSS